MSKGITVHLTDNTMRRFEQIKHYGGGTTTIVKVKKMSYGTHYTLRKIKWSKYKIINLIIKTWLKIKYI